MYYEINVSKDGHHFFATAERSIQTKEAAKRMYHTFKMIFKQEDGYEISVTEYQTVGKTLNWK